MSPATVGILKNLTRKSQASTWCYIFKGIILTPEQNMYQYCLSSATKHYLSGRCNVMFCYSIAYINMSVTLNIFYL